MKAFRRFGDHARKGLAQTTVEYAIIVALIAMAAIGVYMALGTQIQHTVNAETERLASDEEVTVEKAETPEAGSSLQNF